MSKYHMHSIEDPNRK